MDQRTKRICNTVLENTREDKRKRQNIHIRFDTK